MLEFYLFFNARHTHTCVTESLLGFQEDNRNDGTR